MINQNRKNTFIKSQKKRRKKMLSNNKQTLSVYVNLGTKEILRRIKKENNYSTLGDSVDHIADKFS